MKKIMFNDKYGLTQAVLDGRKTQTRRIVSRKILDLVPQYQEEYYAGALESISIEDAIYNITHGEKMAKASIGVRKELPSMTPTEIITSATMPVIIYRTGCR